MNWAEKWGYWTGDPGDDIQDVNDLHGVEGDVDGNGLIPPVEDDHAATFVDADDEINAAWAKMVGSDLHGNWGMETFSRAVLYLEINEQFFKGARCNSKGAKIDQCRCQF